MNIFQKLRDESKKLAGTAAAVAEEADELKRQATERLASMDAEELRQHIEADNAEKAKVPVRAEIAKLRTKFTWAWRQEQFDAKLAPEIERIYREIAKLETKAQAIVNEHREAVARARELALKIGDTPDEPTTFVNGVTDLRALATPHNHAFLKANLDIDPVIQFWVAGSNL